MTDGHGVVSEQQIVHQRAPVRWADGFPLGNGELGAMVWGDGAPLAFTLDRADLWDLRRNAEHTNHPDFHYAALQRLVAEGRFSEVDEIFEQRELRANPVTPTKVSLGRAELRLDQAVRYDCRLELATARVQGTIRTASGEHRIQCFVHRARNVLCLRVGSAPSDARMNLVPVAQTGKSLAQLNHPDPQRREAGEVQFLVQSIPGGPCCAAAWNAVGPDFFLAAETAASADEAVAKAERTWREAATKGFDALCDEHVRAWASFWAGAGVFLPEARMEFLWHYGLYLLASSCRRGAIPPGLQGLWAMDGLLPPWRGDYHADMNVQETFWPACASGHLDLLDSWCDLMKDSIQPAEEFTRRFFGTEGTFWVCSMLPRYTIVPCWHTVQFAWSHSGWLGWLVWLRWRYSMDLDWLADTGYPLIAGIFRFFRANLRQEADGFLHVPLSSSPEYRENKPAGWCKDPNVDLALIRRCCDWVLEMEQALGQDDLRASARDVRAKLAPYHLTPKKELCLWAGKPLDESHRHPSHLMAIHPAMDLTMEDDEAARAIIHASLEHYFSLGQYRWAGHTYAQMASFGAVLGRGEFAYDCLHHLVEYWLGPNGLHFNRDSRSTGVTGYRGPDGPFTMEANCGACAGICDMLVQGWRDTVRVFPAVPDHWRDCAFRDLLTEGAFRVSAVRRNRRTVWVKVVAGVARELRLRNPFGDATPELSGGVLRRQGNLLVGPLEKGQAITLRLPGESLDFEQAASSARRSDVARLGLR